METIAQKIISLGGKLADPATPAEIAALEMKLRVNLPKELKEFLLQHNGSATETEEGIWRFWPCSEITSHKEYRRLDYFHPDNNDLRDIDPTAKAVKLPGSKLILFADALIDAPTYGVFLSPGHQFDGMVFDTSYDYVSALTFADWIAAFIDRAEDCQLFPETNPPGQDSSN